MEKTKPRIILNFEKLSDEIQEQVKLAHPEGFSQHLIDFKNKEGERVSALRFETAEKVYLIRMSILKAEQIISEDSDYDEDGFLTDEAKDIYEDKYSDVELEEDEED